MNHSIYLKLAIFLVKADLKHEERIWKRKVCRSAYDILWHNEYLLRDIGLDKEGRPLDNTLAPESKAKRHVRHLRRALSWRLHT